ncbi:FAD-binding oxidoreductase [Rhizobium leguminosarum]|uniref:FAD-binding oxidoreductase n=1 Tax=Rhizobium leguminosarum TaxID=384 RepID=UPI001C9889DC|nr:FAD-binding oxidoreductase [Rhizobium leguminosarum]MBY5406416.1 FAD-binding oxidoreductase [Rhizobium leguminosarum]
MLDHVAALRELLGSKAVVVGPDAAAYEEGARFDRGKAAFVLRPASTLEVSKAVSYCVRNGLHIVPQAGNTGVVSASTPDMSGRQVVLSVDRLAQRLELDADNRSVRVDAGFLLSDLNAALEPEGLFFPVDLGSNPRLGGMLATNTGGARFLKYGDVRKNTLGLTAVLADPEGTVLDFNHNLRKNNTGVDWKQVFIGTSGSFGIITECVLNVERRPKQCATALLVPSSTRKVMPLLRAMESRLGSYLSAFEGMSENSIKATLEHIPGLRNPFQNGVIPHYTILAEVTRTWDTRESEQSLDSVLENALSEIWLLDDELLSDALLGPAHEMWALRHALPEGVKQRGRLVAFDLAFRRGDLMNFCDRMKAEIRLRFPEVIVCDFGHVGDGGVHFNFVAERGSASAEDPNFERELRDWVYQVVVDEYGGSFSGEHAIGRKNQAYYDKFTTTRLKHMAKQLKAITSPAGLGVVNLG